MRRCKYQKLQNAVYTTAKLQMSVAIEEALAPEHFWLTGLLLRTEAPVVTPNSIDFLFFLADRHRKRSQRYAAAKKQSSSHRTTRQTAPERVRMRSLDLTWGVKRPTGTFLNLQVDRV